MHDSTLDSIINADFIVTEIEAARENIKTENKSPGVG